MEKEFKSEAQLTFWEATAIIVGHGVGSGVLTIPYIASKNNIITVVFIIALVYCINLIMHLMIAELSYNNGGAQFIKCFENELFVGKLKTFATWFAFICLGLSVLMNVSSFVAGGGEVFKQWFGLPTIASELLYYVIVAVIVLFGMKLVGICEKISIFVMVVVIGILFVTTILGKTQAIPNTFIAPSNVLALYGMVSFSLSAVMSTPQVVKGLNGNVKRIRGAIAAGTGINVGIIVVITLMTLLAGGSHVTKKVALVDLGSHLGGWAAVISYIFTLLALSTSFWANTLNIRDIVHEQTHWNLKLCYLITSVPCLIIAIISNNHSGFFGLSRLASVIQVLTGIAIIIAYNRSKKREGATPIVGKFGGLLFQIIVVVSSILASVGAVLPIVK